MQDLGARIAASEGRSAESTSLTTSTDTPMLTIVALALAAVALFVLLMLALVQWFRRAPVGTKSIAMSPTSLATGDMEMYSTAGGLPAVQNANRAQSPTNMQSALPEEQCDDLYNTRTTGIYDHEANFDPQSGSTSLGTKYNPLYDSQKDSGGYLDVHNKDVAPNAGIRNNIYSIGTENNIYADLNGSTVTSTEFL